MNRHNRLIDFQEGKLNLTMKVSKNLHAEISEGCFIDSISAIIKHAKA
jgi:hypothetical protein